MSVKNVLILSCGTGEGHNSAARALEASFKTYGVSCEVRDVLSFKSERAAKRAAGIYGGLIIKAPALFGAVYRLGGLYDSSGLPSPVYSYNASYAKKLFAYIRENGFTHVVCTHLFAMLAMTAVRINLCCNVKSYGVLTDYTCVPFYKDTCLDGYFVPSAEVGAQLAKKKIPADKIFVTGIPVHPKFSLPLTKEQAREKLGIPQDKRVITVLTGGAGCGKITGLCRRLQAFEDCTVYVMTGRNAALKQKTDKLFASNGKIVTVEFTHDVNIYIKAADVVISKAGGLSSTETAVANVPLVHLKAIPGLETANQKYFTRTGLSLGARTVKGAAEAAERILGDVQCAQAMCKIQRHIINADAAEDAARIITEGRANEHTSMALVYNKRVLVGQRNVLQDNTGSANA